MDDGWLVPWMPITRPVARPRAVVPSQRAPSGLRELPPGNATVPVQRVVYRMRNGVLERGFAAWVMPRSDASGAAAGPAQQMTWQPLLGEVRDVQIRAWIAGQGWVPAAALLQRPGASTATGLVTGIEILVDRVDGDRVVRVFPVKD